MTLSSPAAALLAAPREPAVLVVGGGIVGLFCAYHLRLRGHTVTVVERGPIGGPQSCSYGNTGFVGTTGAMPLAEPGVIAQGMRWLLNPDSPFHVKPRWDGELLAWLLHFRRACSQDRARRGFEVLLEMKRRSLAAFRDLCRDGDLAPTFQDGGKLIAFDTPEAFDGACRGVPMAVDRGIPLRILSATEARAMEPDLDLRLCGALFNADDACLQSRDFVVRFAAKLHRMGVTILADTEVRGFAVSARGVETVRTSLGDLAPREVVIAAGAWSTACARDLRLRIPLQPAKGYSVTLRASARGPRRPILLGEGRVAIAPGPGTLRLGGQLALAGFDTRVDPRRIAAMRGTVRRYLPGLADGEVLETWSGFRPCSPDGIPFIGRSPDIRNVTIACGHGHIGMGLAPLTGELVAEIVAGVPTGMDLAPFRLDRFRWEWPGLARPRRKPALSDAS